MADSASIISLPDLGAVLAGLSALSTASFGLLDATKAFWGGVSRLGCGPIRRALIPFDAPLRTALGLQNDWWTIVRSHWVAGVAKDEQKAKARAMIRLGLSAANAPAIAAATNVSAEALTAAARKLDAGKPLGETDLNVLGRMNAAIDILLDAAFEAATQQYRNFTRLLAGVVAVALAYGAWWMWPDGPDKPGLWTAIAVGLLAVPVAPLAKDLTSGLSTAMQALKAARKV